MEPDTDRIEKKVLLRAPLSRVWRAVSDATEFGAWFGVAFEGPFRPGARMTGKIVPTRADAEVAKLQEPYEGKRFEIHVDRIEPERLFSFHWHPFAIDPAFDYSSESMTLVVFALEETPGGTLLTITESGFDRIPRARRAQASTMRPTTMDGPIRRSSSRSICLMPHSRAPTLKASAPLFAALGDQTRLALVVRLCAQGPQSIAKLTAGSDVTRQAVTKHLLVLADAGLVRGERDGRE